MENPQDPGLVISSITVRDDVETILRELAKQADLGSVEPGIRHSVVFSPGSIRLKSSGGKSSIPPENYVCRKPITAWSRKSRANMVARFATLDYSPMAIDGSELGVMITLTYPKDWLTVAPTSKAAKRHLQLFRKRFEREYGRPLFGIWKAEFQRRGAVHFHIFSSAPTNLSQLRCWTAKTWADVVNHPDPDNRRNHELAGTAVDIATEAFVSDARLIAVYFSKHSSPGLGSKEYQNSPPVEWIEAGSVGRFWGYWGLRPVETEANVSREEMVQLARIVRRWFRAKGLRRTARVPRANLKGVIRWRKVVRRQTRLSGGRGFIVVDKGVDMATHLVRYLLVTRPPSAGRKFPG